MASRLIFIFLMWWVVPAELRNQTKFNWWSCPLAPSGQTMMCYSCDSPKSCEKPIKVTCTDKAVQDMADKIASIYTNGSKIEEHFKPTPNYLCFSFKAFRADGEEHAFRGCKYDTEGVKLFRSDFNYSFFWGVKWLTSIREESGKMIAKPAVWHNKTYWDETHWDISSMFQCGDKWCNKYTTPYETGKILFQRRFRRELLWDCVYFHVFNWDDFAERCKIYGRYIYYCFWKWRDHDYRPHGRRSSIWIPLAFG